MRNSIAATLTATAVLAGAAVPASAAARSFEGRIVSIDRGARTFRLHDAERGTKRIKVTSSTGFERVTFRSLRKGMTGIEVTARRSNGRWVALSVERSGGGGHGGDDDGAEDHGGHGNDD